MNIDSVSVIVSTWNRAEFLKNTILSLMQQDFKGKYEIIVVDNNSTDETPTMVKRLMKVHGTRLRYIKEDKQGLSCARNKGIMESAGDIVAFIDDDARADPGWIRYLYTTYVGRENVGVVGGKILLEWPDVSLPSWLTKNLYPSLGFFDLGEREQVEIHDYVNFPHGSNISFLKKAIGENNLFDVSIGRTGRALLAGEEIEACRDLLQKGWIVIYNPHAVVYHQVLPHRLHREYFVDFYRGQGATFAIMDDKAGIPAFIRIRRYSLRLIMSVLSFMKNIWKKDGRFVAYLNMVSSITSLRQIVS